MSELLPCPFCGSPAAIEEYDYYDDGPDYSVQCTNVMCACSGPYCFYRTKEEAVEAWNNRYERTCYPERPTFNGFPIVNGPLHCSQCGMEWELLPIKPAYCPTCGAKVMRDE